MRPPEGQPPRIAERLLEWALPNTDVGRSILGDLRQDFFDRQRTDGRSRAARWFTREVVKLANGYTIDRVTRFVPKRRPVQPSHLDTSRRLKGDARVTTLVRNVRYASRAFRKEPGFAAVIVLIVALAIGANTAILTVLSAVLVRGMPYPDADRLVLVQSTRGPNATPMAVSYLNYRDWRERATVFDDIAAFNVNTQTLSGVDEAQRLTVNFVEPAYLELIGAQPGLGRLFDDNDNQIPMGHPFVVLSHGLWQRQFGGDPDIVAATISLSGVAYTVIGVVQEGLIDVFSGGTVNTDAWVPLMMYPQVDRPDIFELRRFFRLTVLGRIRSDVSFELAGVEMAAIAGQLEEEYPEANRGIGAAVQPLQSILTTGVRDPILALMVGAIFLFISGGVNAAGLFYTRAASRTQVTAVQMALGAGRKQIVGMAITEAMLLAAVGGIVGVLVAVWAVPALLTLSPIGLPGFADIRMDLPVLLGAAGLTVLGGISFGAGAAMQSSRNDMVGQLTSTGRSFGGARVLRIRHTMVISMVAVALVLLVGAGLMIRSLRSLQDADWGFPTEGLLTLRVDLPTADYTPERLPVFASTLTERLNALPGVESADIWGPNLFGAAFFLQTVTVRGRETPHSDQAGIAWRHHVSPGALENLGLEIIEGRGITENDRNPGAPVVVISESMAQEFFPGGEAVGQFIRRFVAPGSSLDTLTWRRVVGVVSNAKHAGRVSFGGGFATNHDQYFSWYEEPNPSVVLAVRTAGAAERIVASARAALSELDPNLAIYDVRTMEELQTQEEQNSRFTAIIMGFFGAIALFLASLGLYGVMSYSLTRRTQEIGLRTALGATPRDNVRLFVGQAMRLTLTGVAIGVLASFSLSRLVSSMLFGVQANDPVTFAGAAVVLVVVASLAAFIPTRRATKVDPLLALRME